MTLTVSADTAHILVVDDDHEIRRLLKTALEGRGFRVSAARNVQEAKRIQEDSRVDLVVLDIMMPGGSGLDFCRDLRARSAVPIILLTALGEEADRVVGLEFGADDYVTKPFGVSELVARIRAALRRMSMAGARPPDGGKIFAFEGWRLDPRRRELTDRDGALIDLTSAEFELLLALVERAGRPLSRDILLDLTRGRGYDAFDRSVDVLISRLRSKLGGKARGSEIIKTVHSVGYVFAAHAEEISND